MKIPIPICLQCDQSIDLNDLCVHTNQVDIERQTINRISSRFEKCIFMYIDTNNLKAVFITQIFKFRLHIMEDNNIILIFIYFPEKNIFLDTYTV